MNAGTGAKLAEKRHKFRKRDGALNGLQREWRHSQAHPPALAGAHGTLALMTAPRARNLSDLFVDSDSPAILRLKMLEMEIAARGPLSDSARESASDIIGALKHAIAEKPALSFADAVAKLKTCDERAADSLGERIDETRKDMMRSAFADWRRQLPR
jgi:hypothetical protein